MPPQIALTMRASVERVEVVRLGRVLRAAALAHGTIAEVADRRLEADLAGDGHAVPAALAVVEQLVAGHAEGHLRDVVVRELGLL